MVRVAEKYTWLVCHFLNQGAFQQRLGVSFQQFPGYLAGDFLGEIAVSLRVSQGSKTFDNVLSKAYRSYLDLRKATEHYEDLFDTYVWVVGLSNHSTGEHTPMRKCDVGFQEFSGHCRKFIKRLGLREDQNRHACVSVIRWRAAIRIEIIKDGFCQILPSVPKCRFDHVHTHTCGASNFHTSGSAFSFNARTPSEANLITLGTLVPERPRTVRSDVQSRSRHLHECCLSPDLGSLLLELTTKHLAQATNRIRVYQNRPSRVTRATRTR